MHSPKESYLKSALQVIKYMKRSIGLSLLMKSTNNLEIYAYYDAMYGSCPMGHQSIMGFCVMMTHLFLRRTRNNLSYHICLQSQSTRLWHKQLARPYGCLDYLGTCKYLN